MMLMSATRSSLENKLCRTSTVVLCVVCLVAVLAISGMAADDYGDIQIIDSYTGEVISDSQESNTTQVWLSNNAYYDTQEKCYFYTLPDSIDVVSSNIMDGMITADTVELAVPASLSFELYKDGELSEIKLSEISEPGKYVLNYKHGTEMSQVMVFTVVGNVTGELYSYQMPAGFRVMSVLLDGERIPTDRSAADLSFEGEYEVQYVCPSTNLEYVLNVKVDHTPPVITLTGVTDGVARGPVTIENIEKGAKLSVVFDGARQSASTELTKSGHYSISLTDEAGNASTAQFTILVYFNTNSIVFFLILLAGAIACIIYAVAARNKLRVR